MSGGDCIDGRVPGPGNACAVENGTSVRELEGAVGVVATDVCVVGGSGVEDRSLWLASIGA